LQNTFAILLGIPVRSVVFLNMCCTWCKTPLKCEIKHAFTHPKNLETAVVYLMAWFHCVWTTVVSNERQISEEGGAEMLGIFYLQKF